MSLPILDEPVVAQALVQAWREASDDKTQARRAYANFSMRRAHAPVKLLAAAGWVLAGMLLSVGSLYAATAVPWRVLAAEVTTPMLESPKLQRHRGAPVPAAPPDTPELAAPTASVSPPVVGLGLKPLGSVAGSGSASTPEQWQRAARGLREGDFASADAALRALTAQTSGGERDAAQLARAQLLLSHGRDAEAMPLLRALQASASSISVRQKASELLSRRKESAPSQRSFGGSRETNQP